MLFRLQTRYKVALFITLIFIIPGILMLYLVETEQTDAVKTALSVGLVISISLLIPISNGFAYFFVLRDLREMNRFCMNIREGRYDLFFSLPNEEEDEPELVKIRRNMNWMLREISKRSASLESRIIESEEMKQEFLDLSLNDSLTCLYNRRCFDCKIKEFVERTGHRHTGFFLMFIDVDKFKQVNDTLGHQAGDRLLVTLGQIVKESTRKDMDLSFRYGGDEFCVIVSGDEMEKAVDIAERIRYHYKESSVGGSTLSIGIAAFSGVNGAPDCCHHCDVDNNIQNLIKTADRAVYLSKHKGGNTITAMEL